jgi:nickel transport protein
VFVLGIFILPCDAHKVKMFASAEGNVITGYLYYTTGGKPKNATVLIRDTSGNALGEVITNESGEFTFTADTKRDYVFVAELADGHRADFTVTADELPDSLPGVAGEETAPLENTQSEAKEQTNISSAENDSQAKEETTAQIPLDEIENIIDKAVSKQIRPLREQLDRYEEKVRLHDVLGGIGYIIGLMGLAYFIGARRKSNAPSSNDNA